VFNVGRINSWSIDSNANTFYSSPYNLKLFINLIKPHSATLNLIANNFDSCT